MKKLITIIVFTLGSFTIAHSQWWGNGEKIKGNGNETTATRNTSEYDQINVRGPLDVNLVSGDEGNITIKAESNFIEYIETKVENGALKIGVKKGYYLRSSKGKSIKITITFKDINEVSLSGSGSIVSSDVIKTSTFKTRVSGSGDAKLEVNAEMINGAVSGSGELDLKGSTQNLECRVSGSGDFGAFELNAKDVTASVSGSGDLQVNATTSLKARVSGSGDIFYKGDPQKIDTKVSGSGDITKR